MAITDGRMPLKFGGYERTAFLGRGASGSVFECVRQGTSDSFAVKAVDLKRLQLIGGPSMARQLKKLRREVDILRSLPSHPNLVHFESAFYEGDWLFFVMELVPLGDLMAALLTRSRSGADGNECANGRPRFLEAEACIVADQLASGLKVLHTEGVVHRDLKPENVLVASERREANYVFYFIKITDFGLSRVIGDGFSDARSTVGTPIYIAPEVMANGLVHGFPADCWSLGILLFVLLDGCFPYEGSPGQDQAKLDARVRELAVSPEAKSILCGLLLLKAECRLTIEDVQKHAWLIKAGEDWGTPQAKRQRISSIEDSQFSAETSDLFGSSCPNSSTQALEVRSPLSKASRPRDSSRSRQSDDDVNSGKVAAPTHVQSPDPKAPSNASSDAASGPSCECGGEMRIRERKQDATQFWGCVRFPVCQKTRDVVNACDVCKKPLVRRSNRRTAEVFFGCSDYPNCKRTLKIHDVAPFCDVCNLAMVRRSKKDDAAVQFWGCQRFPTCRRTRPLLPSGIANC